MYIVQHIKKLVPPSIKKIYRSVIKEPEKIKCRNAIQAMDNDIKIVVGTGFTNYDGWVSTDIHQLNILKADDWKYLLKNKKATHILSEHVWEHITLEDARIANKNCFDFLASKGRLRIAVPDGFFPDQSYIDHVKPGGTGPGSDDHKLLYNYKTLGQELQKVGFKVDLLEYWDENGKFHSKDWSEKDGKIQRSKNFHPKNINGQLIYTSLIVDAIKP